MNTLEWIKGAVHRLQAAEEAYRPKAEVGHDVWSASLTELEHAKLQFEIDGEEWVKSLLPVVIAADRFLDNNLLDTERPDKLLSELEAALKKLKD